jgi:hypothetical protein
LDFFEELSEHFASKSFKSLASKDNKPNDSLNVCYGGAWWLKIMITTEFKHINKGRRRK